MRPVRLGLNRTQEVSDAVRRAHAVCVTMLPFSSLTSGHLRWCHELLLSSLGKKIECVCAKTARADEISCHGNGEMQKRFRRRGLKQIHLARYFLLDFHGLDIWLR